MTKKMKTHADVTFVH